MLGEQPQVLASVRVHAVPLEGGRDLGGRRGCQSAGHYVIGPFGRAAHILRGRVTGVTIEGQLPVRFREPAALREFAVHTPDVLALRLGGSLATVPSTSGPTSTPASTSSGPSAACSTPSSRVSTGTGCSTAAGPGGPGAAGGTAGVGRSPTSPEAHAWWSTSSRGDARRRRPDRPAPSRRADRAHDPDRLIRVEQEPDERLAADARTSARRIADRLPTARWIVEKAISRGHWPEAAAYHLRFGVARWCSCCARYTAPAAGTSGCATSTPTYHDDVRRCWSCCPGIRTACRAVPGGVRPQDGLPTEVLRPGR